MKQTMSAVFNETIEMKDQVIYVANAFYPI